MAFERLTSLASLASLAVAALLGAALWLPPTAAAQEPIVAVQIGPIGDKPVPGVVQMGEGMRAMFASANAQGGINGRRIEFVQLDDAFSADRFVQQFDEAMKRKPLAVLSPFGSAPVQRMLDSKMLDAADTVVLNVVPGADAFRNPGHPKLFHVRASDGQQIDRIAQYIKTLGVKEFAVVYVDAPTGHSGLAVARQAARKLGGIEVAGYQATLAPDSVQAATRAVLASPARATLVVGPPAFTVSAIAALRAASPGMGLFTLSYLVPADLTKVLGANARGVGISQAFPNPMGVTMPLQREFQAAMRKSFPDQTEYTVFQLEGYVTAKLFVTAAKRMKRATPADFAATLRSMGEINLGDFWLDYSKGTSGTRYTAIGVMNHAGRLQY